ncbi:MAG TPA: glycosyltransferase family 4 protein, partial [Polyangiaceae bacterium]|nr:glycosyltransferase family 4 protein [Polyangiaceae bacterium]
RVDIVFIDVRRGRLPYFFSMLAGLARHTRTATHPLPQHTLGVGGLFEMLLMLSCRRFRQSQKILWLRGIFFDEKADRVPSALRGAARKMEGLLLSQAELLLTNGADIRGHYARYGLESVVIENGVDSRRWNMPSPQLGSVLRVGYIGRLSKVKGIEEFLQLAEQTQAAPGESQFEFHVIGAGPYAEQALALQAKGALTYHGSVAREDLPAALERLDVCVALTFASPQLGGGGTSNAMMEQMAAGRVILAWDNVIFRQLLNAQSGYLVRQGDVGALLRALCEIASDRKEALARSLEARAAMANYSIEAQWSRFHQAVTAAPIAWR